MSTTHHSLVSQHTLTTASCHLASTAGFRPRLCLTMLPWLASEQALHAAGWLPTWFIPHLHESLCMLPSPDALFALFEDMALLARAHAVSCPTSVVPAALAAVMAAFEADGEWCPADATLISEWYWLRLPAIGLAVRIDADTGMFMHSSQA